jgi:hypothetical protein
MSGPPSTVPTVCQPLIIETDGVFGELSTGAIINAGGTSSSTWTVNGRGLLFTDGTSTSGGSGTTLTLQAAYNNSTTVLGQAGITLSAGKDFVIMDPNNDGNYFIVSAETGTVTVNGDLIVNGAATTINTNVIQSDHQLITPAAGTTIPLNIQPLTGVTPLVDLITVRNSFEWKPRCVAEPHGGW